MILPKRAASDTRLAETVRRLSAGPLSLHDFSNDISIVIDDKKWAACKEARYKRFFIMEGLVLLACACFYIALLLSVKSVNETTVHPYLPMLKKERKKKEPDWHLGYEERCGNWQHAYTQYMIEMLQQPPEKQRLAVFTAKINGLCDRLTSAVTIFYFALLTKRAFKIDWHNLEPLQSAFDQPNINWTAVPSDTDQAFGSVKERLFNRAELISNWDPVNDYFHKENLNHIDADARTIVFTLNQGQTWTLFENPHHKRDLEALGLTPETAFGCAMHFLFAPRMETVAIMNETWQEIWPYVTKPKRKLLHHGPQLSNVHNATELLIGIQIRYGDWAFDNNDPRCQLAFHQDQFTKDIFRCAQSLSDSLTVPTKFVLITDCAFVRHSAKEHYGDRLITYLPRENEINHVEKNLSAETIRLAVSEMWLLGMTDYQIITRDSSFGRAGAFLSIGWHQIHTMYPGNEGKCGIFDFSEWRELSSHWVRI